MISLRAFLESAATPPIKSLLSGTARQGPPGPRPLLLHQPPARGHNFVTLLRVLILSASWLPTTTGAFHTSPQLSAEALWPTRTSLSCPAPITARYTVIAGTNLRRTLDTSTVSCMFLTRSNRLPQALDSSISGHVSRISDGRRWLSPRRTTTNLYSRISRLRSPRASPSRGFLRSRSSTMPFGLGALWG